MASKSNERGVEILAVSIDGKVGRNYEGLAGTFAGFADSCLRMKTLPGYYRTDLSVEGELKGRRLQLALTGKRTPLELMEILDTALLNLVAFPSTGGEAECFIEVKSEK
ncbi:MAG: hypothetical protein QG555_662 [Thermodesulfobacteriota bacterium]|nr:hypothetical protein [Thermodesulfobacteriota bacterium]